MASSPAAAKLWAGSRPLPVEDVCRGKLCVLRRGFLRKCQKHIRLCLKIELRNPSHLLRTPYAMPQPWLQFGSQAEKLCGQVRVDAAMCGFCENELKRTEVASTRFATKANRSSPRASSCQKRRAKPRKSASVSLSQDKISRERGRSHIFLRDCVRYRNRQRAGIDPRSRL
jgi:hypothetical protein